MSKLASLLIILSALFPMTGALAEGKKSEPGMLSPQTRNAMPPDEERTNKGSFVVVRDPFRPPTEVLPSNCPPSRPLCKFDYSQLKVVGVIQTSGGPYRAVVEDPDGRGHFVASGQMIGTATVTQISPQGILLRLHRGSRDVVLPLLNSEKES